MANLSLIGRFIVFALLFLSSPSEHFQSSKTIKNIRLTTSVGTRIFILGWVKMYTQYSTNFYKTMKFSSVFTFLSYFFHQSSTQIFQLHLDRDPYLCQNSTIDAIFSPPGYNVSFLTKGFRYWKLIPDGATVAKIAPGYPHDIVELGFPEDVQDLDAALSWNGKTYYFKGSKYWRHSYPNSWSLGGLDQGYPKETSEFFAGIPTEIDAAISWNDNNTLYFFKGAKYWKFAMDKVPPISEDYPKSIYEWDGIPANVDGALHTDYGFTYFFKDGLYWKFNDKTFKVEDEAPPYPRLSKAWWFGCPEKEDLNLCAKDTELDTINVFNDANGDPRVYAFKESYFMDLGDANDPKMVKGYPRLMAEQWPGLPTSIDAGFTYIDGADYFFKGSMLWKYVKYGTEYEIDQGYPKKISEEFSGIPDNIDVALPWFPLSDIYFFKGTRYWRYTPTKTTPVSRSYPKPVSLWRGIPGSITAALGDLKKGLIYFFKGDNYYKFDARRFNVVKEPPSPYPRPVRSHWLGCTL